METESPVSKSGSGVKFGWAAGTESETEVGTEAATVGATTEVVGVGGLSPIKVVVVNQ